MSPIGTLARTTLRVAVVAALAAGTTGLRPAVAGAQEWEPQIPEGTGSYPTGALLIQDVDSVWTAADGGAAQILENVDILIVDGVIREIGPDIAPREGVEVIDGRGMHAIPGLVDEHSHTAMVATNEFTAPIVPEVRVMDALDPDA
ncbi:MAG: hypothetical protein PVI57_00215, partial [Gemmatimonadota bacterium]